MNPKLFRDINIHNQRNNSEETLINYLPSKIKNVSTRGKQQKHRNNPWTQIRLRFEFIISL